MFDPILNAIHHNDNPPAYKRVIAGSLCGIMGAASCNPFELVKTRYFYSILCLIP